MFIQKIHSRASFPRNSVATGVIGHCRGLLMACFLRLCLSQRMVDGGKIRLSRCRWQL